MQTSLQKKLLTAALNKIASGRFFSLSGIEFRAYFNHRVNNNLTTRQFLVWNEVEYLLTETGPGNLRLSPELLQLLPKEHVFVSRSLKDSPEKQILLEQKLEIEEYILKHHGAPGTQELIIKILGNFLGGVKVSSTSPLIVNGVFNNIPVSCLIKNGGWILPNAELFSFLQNCQTQKTFPLLIAKKIAGILFPVFKALSVLGLNTHKIYLPEGVKPLLKSINTEENELNQIRYCNQFVIIDSDYVQDIPSEDTTSDPLKHFFKTTLKNHIACYYNDFIQSKVVIKNNFLDTVSQFKKSRNTSALIKNYQAQQKLIQEIKLNFPDQQ